MIVEPKSLEELKSKLKELPAASRRVVILAGRHPNEGTRNLAVKFHDRWARVGATTVLIPAEWTPHGVWHWARKTGASPAQVKARLAQTPDDDAIAELLERRFRIPFLNLHATPDPKFGPARTEYRICRSTRIPDHPAFAVNEEVKVMPNEVLFELYYSGRKRKNAPNSYSSLPRNLKTRTRGQFAPNYLRNNTITNAALKQFEERHLGKFEEVLAHLARTGLRPAKPPRRSAIRGRR